MTKYLPPLAALAALLLFSLWSGQVIAEKVSSIQEDLLAADTFAANADWSSAEEALHRSHRNWDSTQPLLRIASHHNLSDETERLYHQAEIYAAEHTAAEFRAAVANLSVLLEHLAETERCSLQNIL